MDLLAVLRQNRVLLFNAYLSTIDEDLSPLGTIFVDFGLKKLTDLDVLTTPEIETIMAAFENAQVRPFPRNRLRAHLEERKTTAMKLKKSLSHRTAVANAVDPRVDLDLDLVPKSSGLSICVCVIFVCVICVCVIRTIPTSCWGRSVRGKQQQEQRKQWRQWRRNVCAEDGHCAPSFATFQCSDDSHCIL
jgi:hypothetical protein